MIRKAKKQRNSVIVRNTNNDDNRAFRKATQNYLGNNVGIPKNSFWFKDEKIPAPEEENSTGTDIQSTNNTEDVALRELLSYNDEIISSQHRETRPSRLKNTP
ncbi:MAG TPA: hypothetical protein VGF14_02330 [Alphaproteobacteria bacterium]